MSKLPQPDEALLLKRLQALLAGTNTAVSTPLADALYSVLQVAGRSGDNSSGLSRLLDLSDEELIELAENLDDALEHGGEFALPQGSKVSGWHPGSVEIEGLVLTLDAGRPGLFPIETLSRHAHGPNLELLRDEIRRLTRKLACRRIGLPAPVELLDLSSRTLLQFPPLVEGGGVVLQRSAQKTGAARFCAASRQQTSDFAKDIVHDMRSLWAFRRKVGPRVEAVRQKAEQAASEALYPLSVHSINVEVLGYQIGEPSFDLYVEYNAVGDTMRPERVLDQVPNWVDYNAASVEVPVNLAGRYEQLSKLRYYGAHGWIDEMAACILNAAPEGRAAVLQILANSSQTVVTIPVGSNVLLATFFWGGGHIYVEFSVPGELEFFGMDLAIPSVSIPETVLTTLPGKRVDSVIELPFSLPFEITGTKTSRQGGVRLQINNYRRLLVNLETGRIWEERPEYI